MFDVKAFGATGDGVADNTAAFLAAIAAANKAGGGRVVVGSGTWMTGPLRLLDGVELHLEAGATVKFIPEFERYVPVESRWEGVECWAMQACVFAEHVKGIAITGEGVLDGSGEKWWKTYREKRAAKQKEPLTDQEKALAALNPEYRTQPSGGGGRETQFLRPPLVQFMHCVDIRLEGVSFTMSPFWNTHLVYCRNLVIKDCLFRNPADAPNTDGCDIDSCADVHVEHCEIDVGDDCLGLKSGSGPDGVRVNRPTERVTIRDCLMHAGHGGIVVGSETAGGVRDVSVSGCTFIGTDRGLRIKTRRGRGGTIENIHLENCTMKDVLCPVVVNMYYGPGGPPPEDPLFSLGPRPVTSTTPHIRNITVKGLTATGCRSTAGFAVGLPESPIENVTIIDSSFTLAVPNTAPLTEAAMTRGLPPPEGRGFRLRNITGARIGSLKIEPVTEKPTVIEDNVELV